MSEGILSFDRGNGNFHGDDFFLVPVLKRGRRLAVAESVEIGNFQSDATKKLLFRNQRPIDQLPRVSFSKCVMKGQSALVERPMIAMIATGEGG